MFIGHYALAFAAKRAAPRTSLGILVGAAQFLDLLWPILLILNVEQVAPGQGVFTNLRFTSYPWSHSLAMAILWAALAALIYAVLTGDRRGALVGGALVVSHWFLDLVVHQPDLPLYPGGSARLGLGLWNSPIATVVIEGLMFVAGVALYTRGTRPVDRTGSYAWWSFVGFLALIYVAGLGGSPPSNTTVIGWVSMLLWITPVWAWWADRHRTAGSGPRPSEA